MSRSGWVFRIEIVSSKTPWTREIIKELERLFKSSELIDEYMVSSELFEEISLFHLMGKKEA